MIHSVAFNENRSVVSTGYFDANGGKSIVEFWEAQSGRLISRFDALEAAFYGYSEDGTRFFSGNRQRMEVLNEWEIVPSRPWKWILIAWLAESMLTVLVVWLGVKSPEQNSRSKFL